ncbi:MAG: DUF5691 domain-containing protein, partial [Chloroflexi bacterium]|nr:DUF5691 domain-containing protein [Chloroflexota bacterium]
MKGLIAIAAVGTEQTNRALPESSPAVQALINKLGESFPERKLLAIVAANQLRKQAGWLPISLEKQPSEQAEPDAAQICSTNAIRHLRLMLEGHYEEMLPEWLRQVEEQAQRVPPEIIPALLEYGRKVRTLRTLILSVVGERGKWLARVIESRDWQWFEPHDIEKRWKRGSFDTRVELIELLREARPDEARAMVADVWDEEKPQMKVSLLKALRSHMSAADDALFEKALDDESDLVREKAAEIGASNLESSLHQRLRTLADPLLAWEGERLQVNLPDRYDQAMKRDGIKEQNRLRFEKDEHYWLHQILEHIPPQYWCEKWGISAEELLENTLKEPVNIWDVWASTLLHFPNPDFANLLLEFGFSSMGWLHQTIVTTHATDDAIERLVLEMLRGDHEMVTLNRMLGCIRRTWSAELSELYLDLLAQLCEYEEFRNSGEYRRYLKRHTLFIDPQYKEWYLTILSRLQNTEKEWLDMVEDIRLNLEFRIEMLEAF